MSCSSRTFCNSYLVLRRFEPILSRCELVPLDAKQFKYRLSISLLPQLKILALTADVHAVREGTVDRRVHFNQQFLFLSHVMITVRYCLVHPIAEGVPNDGVGNVAKPGSWDFINVSLIWDEERCSLVLIDLLQYEFHFETFVLGHHKHLDVVARDTKELMTAKRVTYCYFLPLTMSLRK